MKGLKDNPLMALNEAYDLITGYLAQEFGELPDVKNAEKIPLAFTTLTEKEIGIQVYADLVNYRLYAVDYTEEFVFYCKQYGSLRELVDYELKFLDFDSLISVGIEEEFPDYYKNY